jgi:hypothetical protein
MRRALAGDGSHKNLASCSCVALIAASAVAEGGRVHIGDPPVGAKGYLGGLACGNLVGG